MSADHPDSLVGEGLDWVIISESAKQNPAIWDKYIRPALADKRGTAIFPSTPEGFNWFYEKFQLGQNGRDPQWHSWRYPSWENPYVYPGGFEDDEIQTQMGTADGTAWFWQEIGADFRAVVGLIYEEWDESVHVKPIRYNPEWGNFMSFDFGFTNPFVGLDIMVDPMENVYIWREYYERGHPAWYHANALKARHSPPGYHIDGGFGDSADPSSVETLGQQFTPVIAQAEAKEWSQGIQEVKKFLSHGKDRPPRLYVDPSCVETINEFNNYRMKKPPRGSDPRQNKQELPEKREDHAMDALRYFIMHKFVLGADTHLEEFMVEDDYDVFGEGGGVGSGIFRLSDDDRMVL